MLLLAGCTDRLSPPGFVGVFEGKLYNTGGPDVPIWLESQLQTQSETFYTFGTTRLGDQTYPMSGREDGSGVRYQTSAPKGRITATLGQAGRAVYCLDLSIGYSSDLPPQGVNGTLRTPAREGFPGCVGESVGSVSLTRKP